MTDEVLRALASEAGLQPRWTDNTGAERDVSLQTLRAALAALGLPAQSEGQISQARAQIAEERARAGLAPRRVVAAGEPLALGGSGQKSAYARVEFELGGAADLQIDGEGRLPPIDRHGYHRLMLGDREIELAVAPASARTLHEAADGGRMWGLAAQIYGLRSPHDGGVGHFGAVGRLAESAARRGADLLALSPAHALFLADENHYTPYSPSNRLFYNALYADPADVFENGRISAARAKIAAAAEETSSGLIDWPRAGRARTALLRALYDDFCASDMKAGSTLAADFVRFRAQGGAALEAHALFEALHAREFHRDFTKWNWRDWAPDLRDPHSRAVACFARENACETGFHVFAQWLVDRSMARAQGRALAAGMRVGLLSDLAVGMNAGGSHAWSSPRDLLLGLSIGAPPDMLAPHGQDWGLAAFSPRALGASGFAPFLATLRAALRNAGGLRVDHVMGLVRLWLVPDGARATEGVYLGYPTDDMLGLLRLESRRHAGVVIGEDLGTVPHGLRERLAHEGVAGLRVLQFERNDVRFNPPDWYPQSAVAMTATHDTATIAGWWRGCDIEARAQTAQLPPQRTRKQCEDERAGERDMVWRAFVEAGVADGACPQDDEAQRALGAAARFVARTPAALAILPLEDALGLRDQPNLPGTTSEYPNWRRRYPGDAAALLEEEDVAAHLAEFDAVRRRA
ncbi:MAG: 4-alpha-glucanotransferase [Rhodoblastus sp.]